MVSLFHEINLGWMFMTPVYGTSGGISSTFVGFRTRHLPTKEIAQVSADNLSSERLVFLNFCRILRQKSHILGKLLAIVSVYFTGKEAGMVKIFMERPLFNLKDIRRSTL
jgi:hypothetical protein